MAGIEKNLDVQWFRQQTLFFCGPAVAQMFLSFLKITVSQQDLWTDITNNTGGTRPPDAPATGHEFPQQVCDNCNPSSSNPGRWECWDTTPDALGTVVATRGKIGLAARYASRFDEGVEMLIDSLDRTPQAPAFATVNLINHWVLVKGYLRDDFTSTSAPVQTVGRYNLNGLYIHDPQEEDEVERVKLVTVNGWRSKFGLIGCGPHIDTYPVVITTAPMAAFVRYAAFLVAVVLLYYFWKWWSSGG
ncbi:MAG TPA: hypothetical protein VFJ02_22995 [Vicinamibacterales bacterium]|nr:hypothetical protein [Vicinamibacterales bacterium]